MNSLSNSTDLNSLLSSAMDIAQAILSLSVAEFRKMKRLADRAMAQTDDAGFFALLDDDANSIAHIVKHLAGNMRSRWTDFLTSDGEKPDRHRDTEFVLTDDDTRAALMDRWEAGWQRVFDAIAPLATDDLGREISIRGEPHTVLQAIGRQLTHYSGHVGQIITLARHFRAGDWESLSIPRGMSEAHNADMTNRFPNQTI